MMYGTKKKGFRRRAGALLLALCLTLSLCPALIGMAYAAGESAMDKLVNWGVVGGYPDGNTHPERSLTRAEFVAMVNRAYGYTQNGPTPFRDVASNAWYYDDIGIAYNAKYFGGVSPRSAAPDSPLTREMAMVLLARNMRLDPIGGEVTEFKDGRSFADWSRGYARAAAQMGLIGGYGDGSYRPQNNITRGEMASMLGRALGTLINKPGTHTLSDVYGNVTISSTGATLKNSTIAGNLYITGGLDLGDVTLDNVRVLGDIIVAGGGESHSGEDSIILRNVLANSLMIDSMADQFVTLRTEGNTEIADTQVRSDAFIQDRTRPGQGLLNISLESVDPEANFTLSGNLENVINKTPNSTLNIAMGTVDTLTIDETAPGSTLTLDINSTAETLNLDTATTVAGVGDIDSLYVNSAGSAVEMLPDKITIRPGLTASIAGETMNAVQAQESSADPRLLAGYPKTRNVAPASATAAFSANKSGTVYWAVSTTTDGSVGEDDLISPTEGSTKALLSGSTAIAASNTETTEALSNLTPDGNYYLTAVMVDARDRHSPVKVASFSTPDNTVPAFNTGYPTISQNDYTVGASGNNYRIQVAAMPNKSCMLYYALYNSGSAAPTAQQFRVGALGQPLQSGVEDATKNVISYLPFSGLRESTTYDLYLCLIDADGARSSGVQKLTFTTVDGTPPEFQYGTPEVTDIGATTLRLRVNLNEDGTVYWVAVRAGTDYLKAPVSNTKAESDENLALFDAYFKRQIENGVNGVRNGAQTVRANTDTDINISGLTSETSYDIYYIAKDKAGNYSEVALKWNSAAEVYELDASATNKNMLTESTLDLSGPTATQEFSLYDTTSSQPYANTDVAITLNENVQRTSQIRSGGPDLVTLYQAVENATTDEARAAAREALGTFLSNTFRLYNTTDIGRAQLIPSRVYRDGAPTDEDWVIDYRNATVSHSIETGTVTVTFSNEAKAINLRSGANYYFQLTDLSDTSSSRNSISGGSLTLDDFTTIAAEVALRTLNVSSLSNVETDNEIDLAFSLTPTSVNVEDSVDWDLLLWADTSVKFDLYYLTPQSNGGYSGVKITPTHAKGSLAFDSAVSENTLNNLYAKNRYNEITITDDMTGYLGKSLFRDFCGYRENPSVNSTLGTLGTSGNDEAYYFGVHFTSVGSGSSSTDRNSWGQTVNFRASVVTGSTRSLGDLANDITEAGFQEAKDFWGVDDIGTPIPFPMRVVFTDTTAPKFTGSYPIFTPLDTSVTMQLMLNHSGTVYYVLAPLRTDGGTTTPTVTTISRSGDTITGITGVPTSGAHSAAPYQLNAPDVSEIFSPRGYTSNPLIKSGSAAVGTGATPVTVTDLEADTTYFVYFVTRGSGSVYSEYVELYTFTTIPTRRPTLNLTLSNPTVNVRSTNMNANANYLLVRYDSAMNALLKNTFYSTSIIDSSLYSTYTALTTSGETDTRYKTLTVLEAMNENATDSSGGSLFDQFAAQTYKDQVASYIRATSANSTSVIANGSLNLVQNVAQSVDCSKFPMSEITQYAFLVVGQSSATGGSGDAFRSIYPISLVDNEAPRIQSITHNLTVYGVGNDATASGRITLTFDENLYFLDQSSSPYTTKGVDRAPVILSGKDSSGNAYVRGNGFVSLDSLVQSSANASLRTITDSSLVNRPTLIIELDVNNAKNGESIVFSNRMCDTYSNVRNTGLTVMVRIVPTQVATGNMDDNDNPIYRTEYLPTVTVTSAWRLSDMTINGVPVS